MKNNIKPDTTIPCHVCEGTGKLNSRECGACSGYGLSTHPYDQRTKATMITVCDDTPRPYLDKCNIHWKVLVSMIHLGVRRTGYNMLIEQPNEDYRGQ